MISNMNTYFPKVCNSIARWKIRRSRDFCNVSSDTGNKKQNQIVIVTDSVYREYENIGIKVAFFAIMQFFLLLSLS